MRFLSPKDFGALIREARVSAGMTQAELGEKVGASRYWVAELERGNSGAELGRTLKALRALKLMLTIEPKEAAARREQEGAQHSAANRALNQPVLDLSSILARSTTPPISQQRTDPFRIDSWKATPEAEHTAASEASEPRVSKKRKRR